jgi:predicted transcriptional regulator
MGRPLLYVARIEDIGPALKDLRLSQGLTQFDVADAMGMHPSHIGSYERNTVCPSGRKMLDFMKVHHYVLGFLPRELTRAQL